MDKFLNNLIAPDVLGKFIQLAGGVVAAGLTHWLKRKKKSSRNYLGWAVTGITAAGAIVVIGLLYNWLTPKPTVGITSPNSNQSIEVELAKSGGGQFPVSGYSERVHTNQGLRIYLLVHPNNTPRWYIQPPIATNSNGGWSGEAQIGNAKFPPSVDDIIEIIAVAADYTDVDKVPKIDNSVADPKDIKPIAQSEIVRVTIGTIKK